MTESMSIDEIIERLIKICQELSDIPDIESVEHTLGSVHSRLSAGELHIAVIGQFNRGKSTFINRLTGIELLPVSVLPLTAIPTELRFGENAELQIRFSNDEHADFDGNDAIESALLRYVTEENNPENEAGVAAVRLTAPSSLLSHGTTIIDTPGFGSTHIHNTKATVSLLKECDAVLFLLSADLPITQMELNFIKQITPHVSRIFFIYNKTDLLSESELETTSNFIKNTIHSQIGIPTEGRFFPVSAKIAKEDRELSGLATIEREVLDFLQREKYFSLAEAISSKLQATRSHLLELIAGESDQLEEHLNNFREEISSIDQTIVELTSKLSAVNQITTHSTLSMESVTTLVRNVCDRFREKIGEMKKFNRQETENLNRQLEREMMSSAGQIIMDYAVQVRDHAMATFSATPTTIPAIQLTELAENINYLPTPNLFSSSDSKRNFLLSSLTRFSETAPIQYFEKMILLIRRFETESATSIAESLCKDIEKLQIRKTEIESELTELVEKQKERTDLLQSIHSEIEAMKI